MPLVKRLAMKYEIMSATPSGSRRWFSPDSSNTMTAVLTARVTPAEKAADPISANSHGCHDHAPGLGWVGFERVWKGKTGKGRIAGGEARKGGERGQKGGERDRSVSVLLTVSLRNFLKRVKNTAPHTYMGPHRHPQQTSDTA